jgi:hypothetical protein
MAMNHSLTPLALDPSELARLRSGGVVQRKGVPRSLEGLITRQLVREQSAYGAAVQPNASAR